MSRRVSIGGNVPDNVAGRENLHSTPAGGLIVASSDYVKTNGAPKTPREAEEHPFIIYRPEQNNSTVRLRRNGKQHTMAISGTMTVNSVSAIRQLVRSGKGLHLGPTWAFAEELDDGSVVRVLPDYALEAFPLHAVYVSSSYVPAKVRAFIDLMKRSVRSNAAIAD